jgi:hypothetical protein
MKHLRPDQSTRDGKRRTSKAWRFASKLPVIGLLFPCLSHPATWARRNRPKRGRFIDGIIPFPNRSCREDPPRTVLGSTARRCRQRQGRFGEGIIRFRAARRIIYSCLFFGRVALIGNRGLEDRVWKCRREAGLRAAMNIFQRETERAAGSPVSGDVQRTDSLPKMRRSLPKIILSG